MAAEVAYFRSLPSFRPGATAAQPFPAGLAIDRRGENTGVGLVPAILRQRNYRLFFLATVTSAVGDAVGSIALAFAVLDLTGSAGDLGLVLGAEALALAIFVLLGGAFADRVPRRRLMVASDLVRAGTQITIVALLVTGTATIILLAILGFVYGVGQAFFLPASIGVMPLIVRPEDLQPANSLRSIAYSTSFVAGPVIGGALIVFASPAGAIALDATTFLVSAVALLAMHPRAAAQIDTANSIARDVVLGWHEVHVRPWVQSVLAALTFYHVFAVAAIFVLGPLYAKDISTEPRPGQSSRPGSAWGCSSAACSAPGSDRYGRSYG